jgi:hypothetical protein
MLIFNQLREDGDLRELVVNLIDVNGKFQFFISCVMSSFFLSGSHLDVRNSFSC